ncbi:hypothetical protein [Riemerella anatipestifer]|uniref:hypothetical protein n=1 Tax=Riemerella anatipestifer TaxID=34085 RepID=UPI00069A6CDC|nr:hypothetical protein [Riemerella anatipestifer]
MTFKAKKRKSLMLKKTVQFLVFWGVLFSVLKMIESFTVPYFGVGCFLMFFSQFLVGQIFWLYTRKVFQIEIKERHITFKFYYGFSKKEKKYLISSLEIYETNIQRKKSMYYGRQIIFQDNQRKRYQLLKEDWNPDDFDVICKECMSVRALR